MWRNKAYMERRRALADIATGTKEMTPAIGAQLPHLDPISSECLDLASLPPLDLTKCPGFILPDSSNLGTPIHVFNKDALDTAISMPTDIFITHAEPVSNSEENKTPQEKENPEDNETTTSNEVAILQNLKSTASNPETLTPTAARVAVLNMASEFNPGGGWLKGSTAQEEAICYRSTLAASLHREMYPIPARSGLYTRDVVIIRSSIGEGHGLMVPGVEVVKLPVVSVVSVAGVRRSGVKMVDGEGNVVEGDEGLVQGESVGGEGESISVDGEAGQFSENIGSTSVDGVSQSSKNNDGATGNRLNKTKNKKKGGKKKKMDYIFANEEDRDLTKDKIRLCLRMAASKGHTMLVLGAMGCGAFRNPPKEIASCWMEVLSEDEFAGGWFKEIWFAVFDRRREGNFEVFEEKFDGKVVGVRERDGGKVEGGDGVVV